MISLKYNWICYKLSYRWSKPLEKCLCDKETFFHILINGSTAHVSFTLADADFTNSVKWKFCMSDAIMCPHPFKIQFSKAVVHMYSYNSNYLYRVIYSNKFWHLKMDFLITLNISKNEFVACFLPCLNNGVHYPCRKKVGQVAIGISDT